MLRAGERRDEDSRIANKLAAGRSKRNSEKILEALETSYTLCFDALISSAGCDVFVFLGSAAGPLNHHAIDFVPLAYAECHRQFGLGKIARPAFDQA